MQRLIIDFRRIADSGALHDYLERNLKLPAYYGRNLDALYDVLTVWPDGLIIETVPDHSTPEKARLTDRTLRMLFDAAEENDLVHVRVVDSIGNAGAAESAGSPGSPGPMGDSGQYRPGEGAESPALRDDPENSGSVE
ncbi:MAG: barstar family protein [Lachnospiraceae bacterium]|jgi:RNAse (barnase) inhibitor barstar